MDTIIMTVFCAAVVGVGGIIANSIRELAAVKTNLQNVMRHYAIPAAFNSEKQRTQFSNQTFQLFLLVKMMQMRYLYVCVVKIISKDVSG